MCMLEGQTGKKKNKEKITDSPQRCQVSTSRVLAGINFELVCSLLRNNPLFRSRK